MIRPCGPEPCTCARSNPFCPAIRRASGEAKIRSPEVRAGAGAGAGACALAGSAFASALGASVFGASDFAGSAMGAAAAASSPLSRAIGVLTFTPSEPSGTRISSTTPSSTASTSMVALSVSISAITSPDETLSPFFTCHLASVPSSMVGESAGIRTSMDIFKLLRRWARLRQARWASSAPFAGPACPRQFRRHRRQVFQNGRKTRRGRRPPRSAWRASCLRPG